MIDIVMNLFSTLFPFFADKLGEQSEWRKRYEDLRLEIAAALTMNACYYSNPVDIARTKDHCLPDDYAEGSKQLRELGAKISALAETMPKKVKDMPVSKQDLMKVSGELIGLSNSFTTPYNMGASEWHYDFVKRRESTIRKLLNLDDGRG